MKSLYEMWKTTKKTRENKEACIKKFNAGGKAFANFKCAFNSNILINNSGVLYNTKVISEYFFISIESIIKVEVKSDEELTKGIIENKKPLIGGLTFPRIIHFFLIINYEENNLQHEKTIESKAAVFGATSILKARQEYIKNHPSSILKDFDYTLELKSPNEGQSEMDIPDQINKLFELVEKGALSTEEFNQKKKELLLKM